MPENIKLRKIKKKLIKTINVTSLGLDLVVVSYMKKASLGELKKNLVSSDYKMTKIAGCMILGFLFGREIAVQTS